MLFDIFVSTFYIFQHLYIFYIGGRSMIIKKAFEYDLDFEVTGTYKALYQRESEYLDIYSIEYEFYRIGRKVFFEKLPVDLEQKLKARLEVEFFESILKNEALYKSAKIGSI